MSQAPKSLEGQSDSVAWAPNGEYELWGGYQALPAEILRDIRQIIENYRAAEIPKTGGVKNVAIHEQEHARVTQAVQDILVHISRSLLDGESVLMEAPEKFVSKLQIAVFQTGAVLTHGPKSEAVPFGAILRRVEAYLCLYVLKNRNAHKKSIPAYVSALKTGRMYYPSKARDRLNTQCKDSFERLDDDIKPVINDELPELDLHDLAARNKELGQLISKRQTIELGPCIVPDAGLLPDKETYFSHVPGVSGRDRYLALVRYVNRAHKLSEADDFVDKLEAKHLAKVASYGLNKGDLPPFSVERFSGELFISNIGPESLKLLMGVRRYELLRYDVLSTLAQLVCRAEELPKYLAVDFKKVEESVVRSSVQPGREGIPVRHYPLRRRQIDPDKDASESEQDERANEVVARTKARPHRRLLPLLHARRVGPDGRVFWKFRACRPSAEALQRCKEEQPGMSLGLGIEVRDPATGAIDAVFLPGEVENIIEEDDMTLSEILETLGPNAHLRYETYVSPQKGEEVQGHVGRLNRGMNDVLEDV